MVQGRPAQNGIEGEAELDDVEHDTFRAEVLKRPECDQDGDTSTRNDQYWDHHREWVRQLELRHRYLHLFESYQANQIQRCTIVDKDVVQLDVDDGWGDKQQELSDPCHALREVRGVVADRRLHPPVVWGRPWSWYGRGHLSA
jgi:hypothetical protein